MLRTIKRALFTAFVAVFILVSGVYAADYLVAWFHIPRRGDLYSTMTVRPYYAVRLKDNKTEFYFLEPQTEVCIHSLFPHFGHRPCWYVSRHKHPRINM